MPDNNAAPQKSQLGAAPPDQCGRLNDEQRALFVELKAQFRRANLVPGQRVWFDDATILRYLRARGWNVSKALKQMLTTDDWRREKLVDNLYSTIDVEEFQEARNFCPKWTGRRDKAGRPLFVYKMAEVTSPATLQRLQQIPEKRQIELVTVLSEIGERCLFDLCSSIQDRTVSTPEQVGTSITCTSSILDMEGMPFTGFWNLRGLLQKATQISSAHHPETAYLMAIVNAPAFFSSIWSWMKGWIDEGTRSKILILSKGQMQEELLRIIDAEDLPQCFGGKLQWTYDDDPVLDEELSKALGGIATPPRGPWTWKDGKLTLVGTVDGKPRNPGPEKDKAEEERRSKDLKALMQAIEDIEKAAAEEKKEAAGKEKEAPKDKEETAKGKEESPTNGEEAKMGEEHTLESQDQVAKEDLLKDDKAACSEPVAVEV